MKNKKQNTKNDVKVNEPLREKEHEVHIWHEVREDLMVEDSIVAAVKALTELHISLTELKKRLAGMTIVVTEMNRKTQSVVSVVQANESN